MGGVAGVRGDVVAAVDCVCAFPHGDGLSPGLGVHEDDVASLESCELLEPLDHAPDELEAEEHVEYDDDDLEDEEGEQETCEMNKREKRLLSWRLSWFFLPMGSALS